MNLNLLSSQFLLHSNAFWKLAPREAFAIVIFQSLPVDIFCVWNNEKTLKRFVYCEFSVLFNKLNLKFNGFYDSSIEIILLWWYAANWRFSSTHKLDISRIDHGMEIITWITEWKYTGPKSTDQNVTKYSHSWFQVWVHCRQVKLGRRIGSNWFHAKLPLFTERELKKVPWKRHPISFLPWFFPRKNIQAMCVAKRSLFAFTK